MKFEALAAGLAVSLVWAGPAAAENPASASTRIVQDVANANLPWADKEDEDFASRGFIATAADPLIRNGAGKVVWDLAAHANLSGPAPATVNPSLWRHAGLLGKHGLFKVRERLYQVRGFDVSNMSVIEGDTGYILIDPLTTTETAAAAMALVKQHLGDKPVRAIIYTHSHGDHFGGARGIVSEGDVAAGRVQILAPEGFLEHAVSENVIAGNAMGRRAAYQFGGDLAPGPEGQMTSGIGAAIPSGTISLIPPTRIIAKTGELVRIDGIDIEFQITPNTEAPAEMNLYLPQLRALCMAENANVSMHNILTPRGALVRDAKAWADQLTVSTRRYGDKSDVLFISHGWPRFGTDRLRDYLESHRDAYKYLHDQTVRMMNQGLTGPEIAERIALPETLSQRWFNRGYYGTMRHNSRAIYQRYMGWYDANPAHLNVLPPEDAAKRYVAAMGGPARVLREGKRALAKGDYRWAAEVLNHLVFAAPDNSEARSTLAEAHRQMGYQAESAIWRNMYLMAAKELETGVGERAASTGGIDFIRNTPSAMIFDLLSVRLDPAQATGPAFSVAFAFPDRSERHFITIRNGVLVHEEGVADAADVTVTMPRAAFLQGVLGGGGAAAFAQAKIEGDVRVLQRFGTLFDSPDPNFSIVTP
jgi:alkyl sulfatase BDS1-like metallo-beta-lactamase superfamily hydrolase